MNNNNNVPDWVSPDDHFTDAVMDHIVTALSNPLTNLSFLDFDPNVNPPIPMEIMNDGDYLSILLVHPMWAKARDPSMWIERQLKNLLLSKDKSNTYLQLEHTSAKIDPAVWAPCHDKMLITGIFSRVPPEMIWRILPHLDLLSVSNLSRVCRYLRSAVLKSPMLKFVFQTMPAVIKVLAKINLLKWHTMNDLVVELSQLHCRTCGGYASSVFLPTCERTCMNCLVWNPDFSLIVVPAIESAFNFTPETVRELPIVRTIVQRGQWTSRPTSVEHHVTPIKCAIAKAFEVHGDVEGIVRAAQEIVPWAYHGLKPSEVTLAQMRRHISNECLALNYNAFLEPHAGMSTHAAMEVYMGRGSMDYPYLPPVNTTAPDLGFCRGCLEALSIPYPFNREHIDYMGYPVSVTPGDATMLLTKRARVYMTWDDLVKNHLPRCLGAHMLMYEYFGQRTPPNRANRA